MRVLKIILGVIFLPYGIYLIYRHYKNKSKQSTTIGEISDNNIVSEEIIKNLTKSEYSLKEGLQEIENNFKNYQSFRNTITTSDKKGVYNSQIKFILELIEMDKFLFGLQEKTSGIIFCESFFLLVGRGGVSRYDYRVLNDLKFGLGNFYFLNQNKLDFSIDKNSKEYYQNLIDIQFIFTKIIITDNSQLHKFTKHRSNSSLSNSIERWGEKNMNVFEIQETQENLEIEVVEISKLDEILLENQNSILESQNGQEYLQKFVKLKKHTISKNNELSRKITQFKNETIIFNSEMKEKLNEIKRLNRYLSTIYMVSYGLITQYLNKDMVRFFETYELLDELGLFNSSFENNLLQNLESINTKLDKINSNLNYLNIISSFNTYQLYKINDKLKQIK